MQIAPLPVPLQPNVLSIDNQAKAIAPVLAKAAAPVTEKAVAPPPKSERNNQSRSNGDRSKGGKREAEPDDPEHSVNMRV